MAGPAGTAPGHRGLRAVQQLVEYAPSTGGLALWVQHRDLPGDERDVDEEPGTPVWTEGSALHYTAAFEALPLQEQTGWVAHQVLHIALRHAQRCQALRARLGDVDERLFNTCADAVVNSALSHLGWLALAPGAVRLPALLAATLALDEDDASALARWDVESLYRMVDDRRPPDERGRRRDGPRSARTRVLGGAGRGDLRPAAGAERAPEQEAELTRDWAERLARAHAGDGEMSLLRGLLADLPRQRTPWEALLRTRVARALAQQPALSWSRPARSWLANQGRLRGRGGVVGRMPWEPGHTASQRVPRLVLVLDVSGSIEQPLLQRFGAEIEALARRWSAGLWLVVGDDHVQQVLQQRPGRPGLAAQLAALPLEGGGTDFAPLLAEALRHGPDLIVVLTDLDGPAGPAPRCPVLWAVPPAHAGAAVPFGRKLVLD